MLFSFALSFLPSFFPFHRSSLLALLVFFSIASVGFFCVVVLVSLLSPHFLLSVAFRDIHLLWSRRKKELGFWRRRKISHVWLRASWWWVMSHVPLPPLSPLFFIAFVSFVYTLFPTVQLWRVGPDEGRVREREVMRVCGSPSIPFPCFFCYICIGSEKTASHRLW